MLVKLPEVFIVLSVGVKKNTWTDSTIMSERYINQYYSLHSKRIHFPQDCFHPHYNWRISRLLLFLLFSIKKRLLFLLLVKDFKKFISISKFLANIFETCSICHFFICFRTEAWKKIKNYSSTKVIYQIISNSIPSFLISIQRMKNLKMFMTFMKYLLYFIFIEVSWQTIQDSLISIFINLVLSQN